MIKCLWEKFVIIDTWMITKIAIKINHPLILQKYKGQFLPMMHLNRWKLKKSRRAWRVLSRFKARHLLNIRQIFLSTKKITANLSWLVVRFYFFTCFWRHILVFSQRYIYIKYATTRGTSHTYLLGTLGWENSLWSGHKWVSKEKQECRHTIWKTFTSAVQRKTHRSKQNRERSWYFSIP